MFTTNRLGSDGVAEDVSLSTSSSIEKRRICLSSIVRGEAM